MKKTKQFCTNQQTIIESNESINNKNNFAFLKKKKILTIKFKN